MTDMVGVSGKYSLEQCSNASFIQQKGIQHYVKRISFYKSYAMANLETEEEFKDFTYQLESHLVNLTNIIENKSLDKSNEEQAIQLVIHLINDIGAVRKKINLKPSDVTIDCFNRIVKVLKRR